MLTSLVLLTLAAQPIEFARCDVEIDHAGTNGSRVSVTCPDGAPDAPTLEVNTRAIAGEIAANLDADRMPYRRSFEYVRVRDGWVMPRQPYGWPNVDHPPSANRRGVVASCLLRGMASPEGELGDVEVECVTSESDPDGGYRYSDNFARAVAERYERVRYMSGEHPARIAACVMFPLDNGPAPDTLSETPCRNHRADGFSGLADGS